MPGKMMSAVLLLFCTLSGVVLGHIIFEAPGGTILLAVCGLLTGFACMRLLKIWHAVELKRLIGGAVGTLSGALLALMIFLGLSRVIGELSLLAAVYVFVLGILCLIGMQLGSARAEELIGKDKAGGEARNVVGILDTSVIIDGRIADVCETGFLDGDLIIPEFILHELQMIADASESTKRTRGRRGLDILNKIQKQQYVSIIIDDRDYPKIKEVDQKLINMAKETGAAILTNDYNLNKVADVHSIQVLNINQLANALKPIVLPGETMKVKIIKDGKEPAQGLAYLDDGTMVVVDHGRRRIGNSVDVTVTSVLQTTAGRMIFASMKE
jgi:uncharacterized protein YacL